MRTALPVGSLHISVATGTLAWGVPLGARFLPKRQRSAAGGGALGLAPLPAIARLALGECFGVVDGSEEGTRRSTKTELLLSSSSVISQRQSFCHIHSRPRNFLGVKNRSTIAKETLAMAESQTSGSAGCESPVKAVPDARVKGIAESIRSIRDFPKPGILFRDVTTLLLNPKAFKDCIDICVERYAESKIDVVAGIEARGFIFGPPIALALGAKFVPVRKAKKLPGEVIGEEYSLEYGTDKIEIHVGAVNPGDRIIVVDDLIATGGTLGAALRLMERVGGEVVECVCVIELPELKGRAKLNGKPLFTVVEFEGH
ncbi:hypothetical protein CBR_g34312 [Chara braunii]|uniref:adenine phosphoribosyltransferase n=1 Tax=Chara braunii TaxID=69332 RepID=A0A388JYQ0_CHABU|nr:hypothetical protein CBR_g34312 [Chara braunii]|eukprot:GBG62941.1 hypothetical protein CBR_g34312 [Chara braunii]